MDMEGNFGEQQITEFPASCPGYNITAGFHGPLYLPLDLFLPP